MGGRAPLRVLAAPRMHCRFLLRGLCAAQQGGVFRRSPSAAVLKTVHWALGVRQSVCSSARSRGDSEPLGARVLAMDVDSGDDEPGSAAGSDDDVAMASAGGGGGGGDESDAEPRAASEDDSGVEDSGRRSGAGRLRRAFPAAGQSTKHTHASAARRAAPRAAARAPRLRGRRDPPTGDPRSRSSLSRRALAASSRGELSRRPAATRRGWMPSRGDGRARWPM